MTELDPYKTYADETILNASPLGLVVALYEGAIDSAVTARKYLIEGNIPARTKAINKLTNIVNELMRSLNDEKGGEVSANLRRLYGYVLAKVSEAHTQKQTAPLNEVERLLSTMLEGWKVADAKFDPAATFNAALVEMPGRSSQNNQPAQDKSCTFLDSGGGYGNYLPDLGEINQSSAYSF